MSDLKRRKLPDKNNQRPAGNQPRPPQQQQQQQNRNPNRRPQQRQPQRQAPRQVPRPPPPPPAFMQRDLLLITTADSSKGIEEVRTKFDPLSKKIPAHVTLLFPEPSKAFVSEFLKNLATAELPSLRSLQFSQVIVHDEMYLWLIPNEESREKLMKWREVLLNTLVAHEPNHSQGEEFVPHITLGYVPRSLTPEEAVAFAQNLITLPAEVNFAKILLEEFSENQVSTSVDALILNTPTEPHA
jgi:2'-5' RNA ligase